MKGTLFTNCNFLLVFLLSCLGLIIGLYLMELVLAIYWQSSLLVRPVPPLTTHRHITADYQVEYNYNSLGLRGSEFSKDQAYDLVLLGDSFFFGQGVSYEETLAALLEAQGLSVLNISEIATNPHFHLEKLVTLKKQGLQAQFYILGLFWGNDFQGYTQGSEIDRFMNTLEQREFSRSTLEDLFSLSRIRFLLASVVTRINCRECLLMHMYRYQQHFESDWISWYTHGDEEAAKVMRATRVQALTEKDYLERANINPQSCLVVQKILQRISSVADGKLLIVHIPDLHFIRSELGPTYRALVERFIRDLPNIKHLDLHTAHLDQQDYFEGDGHWNASGHKKVMDLLTQILPFRSEKGSWSSSSNK